MPIIVDLLKRRASSAAPAAGDHYWESDWQSISRERLVARAQETESIRAALLSLYGPEAESAAPLRDLFRPLDTTLPFLSPAEQRAVAQFRLTHSLRMAAGPPPMGAGALMPAAANFQVANAMPTSSVIPGSHAEFMTSLPKSLSSASAFEFALRESPLAARLRAARAGLTESEFRAVFTAMADAERNHVPLPLDLPGSGVPRSKMLKVASQSDPAWSGLQAAAARSSIPEQQVWSVYEVVRQTNESLAAIAQGSGGASRERAQQMVAVMEERRSRIEQLVGPEAAGALLDAINQSYRTFALRAAPDSSRP